MIKFYMSDLLGIWYTRKVKFCFQSKKLPTFFILHFDTNEKLSVDISGKNRLFDFILAIVYTGGLESQRRRNYGTGSKHPRVNWDLTVNNVCLRLSLAKQKKKIAKFKLIMRSERLFNCLILSFMYEYILGGDSGRGCWLVRWLMSIFIEFS